MYSVILSPDAFRLIMSSTLEAYAVPHGRNDDPNHYRPLETYGALWGYSVTRDGETIFHITAADIDSSAHRTPNWVRRKHEALCLKSGFYKRYNRELEYLGDFHSHPYSAEADGVRITARDVESQHCYRFSGTPGDDQSDSGDFADVKYLKEANFPYRIGFVATVYKMTKVVANPREEWLDGVSAIRFTYNGPDADETTRSFRCWLKAYIFPDETNTPASDNVVTLLCPSLGFLPCE